jgi:hypothetical protein
VQIRDRGRCTLAFEYQTLDRGKQMKKLKPNRSSVRTQNYHMINLNLNTDTSRKHCNRACVPASRYQIKRPIRIVRAALRSSTPTLRPHFTFTFCISIILCALETSGMRQSFHFVLRCAKIRSELTCRAS